MSKSKGKWWLAIVVVCCLAPGALARREPPCDHDRDDPRSCRQSVPEGGSAAGYLLGAGLTCFGAMFLRSRVSKPSQS
jgi:hypothetical protein